MLSSSEYLREIADNTRNLGGGGVTVSENFAQVGGNPVNTNAGNAGAGTQRVVLASDQPSVPTNFSAATRTVAISSVSSSGSVAAGKKYISLIFSSDFTGTVGGVAFVGATDAFYDVPKLENGETYAALSYTVTAGSVRITSF
jgi:hypothetical protein